MNVNEFIDIVSADIVKSCNDANLLPSPSIAQAIIESRYGTSTLAQPESYALFGIKADSRWNGKVVTKDTKECYDGINLVPTKACFRAYNNWTESILDHTNFLLVNKRYSNLVGVRDYKQYCQLIKADGYATSPTYAQTLIDCIERYNLTQYDVIDDSEVIEPEEKPVVVARRFNIHAGHNPSGKVACGSVGYLNESDENRVICQKLVEKIRSANHTVFDCTCNDGTSQKDVLQKIVAKCNENDVELDISIHFNAVSKEFISDGKSKGTEVYIHSNSKGTVVEEYANAICKSISDLGFTNRGVKINDSLYVLRNTKSPAMLIECCFVDDIDDFELYDAEKMADAIVKGLGIEKIDVEKKLYYVIAGIYSSKENAENFANNLAEKGYLMDENGNLIKGIITQIKEIKG